MQGRIRRLVDDRTQTLAAVSHDLKTPITRLRLRAEFVDDEDLRTRMTRDLDEMEVMIDQALSFLRGDGRDGSAARVRLDAERSILTVMVDYDGPGIPESERETVFNPFHRLEDSRNRETGGTGLGLTIARTIIRAHGGDVTLQDGPVGGLRVVVKLPRPDNDQV